VINFNNILGHLHRHPTSKIHCFPVELMSGPSHGH